MERYHFCKSSCTTFGFNCDSLSGKKSNESETEGALATIIKLLKQIHSLFFEVYIFPSFYLIAIAIIETITFIVCLIYCWGTFS